MGFWEHWTVGGVPEEDVGRFTVEFEAANYGDLTRAEAGDIPPEEVRSVELTGWIDTGAHHVILPEFVGDSLGLPDRGRIRTRFANEEVAMCRRVTGLQITIGDRTGLFDAVLVPGRTDALIGALVLENLDLLVDPANRCLVPRDPETVTGEITHMDFELVD